MMSTLSRDMGRTPASSVSVGLIGIVLAGCTSTPLPATSGQTTTTYGSSSSTGPADTCDSGCDGTGDAWPDESTDTDPSDSGPDDADTGPPPWDVGIAPDVPNPPGLPDGSSCTADVECSSGDCYVMPFLGGFCGQCNEDADCFGGGCTPPNPFDGTPPFCNMGELGAGCESDDVCGGDLSCGNVFDLLGLIQLNSCGSCLNDAECGNQICAPLFELSAFAGHLDCIDPQSLPQNAYCDLESNGNEVCASGFCSVVDVMGLAELGACGECNVDTDCNGGICVVGELLLDTGMLLGSTCQ